MEKRKNMKKARHISLILAISILLPFSAHVNVQAKDFPDVGRDHWAYEAINVLSNKGVIAGDGYGNFNPGDNVAVDQFIKLMVTAMGYDPGLGSPYWASTYIDKAKQLGLFPEGEFNDYGRPITRLEIARLVSRAMKNEQFPVDIEVHSWQLKDFYEMAVWERDYISRVFLKGIVIGLPDGTFGADRSASRAEAALMVHRYIDTGKRIPAKDKQPEGVVFKPSTDYEIVTKYEGRPEDPGYYWHLDPVLKHVTFFERYGEGGFYAFENYLPKEIDNPLFGFQAYNLIKALYNGKYATFAKYYKPKNPNWTLTDGLSIIVAETEMDITMLNYSKYLFAIEMYENTVFNEAYKENIKANISVRNLKDDNGNLNSGKMKKLWDCCVAMFGLGNGNAVYDYIMGEKYKEAEYNSQLAGMPYGSVIRNTIVINHINIYSSYSDGVVSAGFNY